jgi:hypothetical protein
MRRFLALSLFVCLFTSPAMAAIEGSWTSSSDGQEPARMYFSITRGTSHQSGMTMPVSAFDGLTAAQIASKTTTPAEFAMRREAGTIAFEGTFRGGHGAGQFTFTPDRAYIAALRGLGVAFELDDDRRGAASRESEEEDLFTLALHDVSTDFIRSMQESGFRVSLEKYLALRIFGVTPQYVREMRSLISDLDADDIIGSRIHKVTPDYVRRMRAAGWSLSFEDLQSSSIHGATPEFAESMRKLGYGKLSFDDLVAFRIHRVTEEFIRELGALGYDRVEADDLVAMRIHRVTPEFIRELQEAGYRNVPVDKLVAMRIHGLDAQKLRKMSGS